MSGRNDLYDTQPLLTEKKGHHQRRSVLATNERPSRLVSLCLRIQLVLLAIGAIVAVLVLYPTVLNTICHSIESSTSGSSTASSWCKSISDQLGNLVSSSDSKPPKMSTSHQATAGQEGKKPVVPIMDNISQFTDFETMPLELASMYYKSLKSDNPEESIKSFMSSKFSSQDSQRLAKERGKALKRIFDILNQGDQSSAMKTEQKADIPSFNTLSVPKLFEMLGKPDQIETSDKKNQVIPGMAPGPYISSEFKPEKGASLMDFIYYGESTKQGMKITVNEMASSSDVASTASKDRSKVLGSSWFGTVREE